MLNTLYNQNSLMNRIKSFCDLFFSGFTKQTREHLLELTLAMLAMESKMSIKYLHQHFIAQISQACLNSFYYLLANEKIDIDTFACSMAKTAMNLIPKDLVSEPLFLSIDDTLVEKFGTKFDHISKLFDHASHNGTHYMNGHCFACLMLYIPVHPLKNKDLIRYIPLPLSYQLWDKGETKLVMTKHMIENILPELNTCNKVVLLCDSWYPKGEILDLVMTTDKLELICNVRIDTVLYDLPPERTAKRGRPRIRGNRLELEDIPLEDLNELEGEKYFIGHKTVITNLFGDKHVEVILTQSKEKTASSRRLFLSTLPGKALRMTLFCQEKDLGLTEKTLWLLPLKLYKLRWQIEVNFYESKTFWNFTDYRVRNKHSIECLINVSCICYGAMKLLPYCIEDLYAYQEYSVQEVRFKVSQCIQREVFFASLAQELKQQKNKKYSLEEIYAIFEDLLLGA